MMRLMIVAVVITVFAMVLVPAGVFVVIFVVVVGILSLVAVVAVFGAHFCFLV
jgi:hypothetical protein